MIVRLRDRDGREVQKLSQQYVLSGESSGLEAARRGEILFYREPDLQPGLYTMETIVFDAAAGLGSARVATLTVPPAGSAPGMSSLVLVNRVERVSDGPAGATTPPLYVGNRLLYPNLGEPVVKSAAKALTFYFALYGDTGASRVEAQLLRNGEILAASPIALPAGAGPRVQHVGELPVDALPAGTYELRILATTATRELSRTAYFTLQD